MTIRTKVRLGAALTLALFFGVCWLVVDRMTDMLEHSDYVTDELIPALEITAEMGVTLGSLRTTEALHVIERDPEKMITLEAEIERLQKRMNQLLDAFKPLVASPEEQAAYDTFSAYYASYIDYWAYLLPQSQANRIADATRILRASAPLHGSVLQHLEELDRLTRTQASDARVSEGIIFERTQFDLIAAALVLAAALIGVAVAFSYQFVGPARQLVAVIDDLAVDNLTAEVPHAKRVDELGDVARALVHFRSNAIDKQRLQRQERDDLDFARRLQLASVPSHFPAFPDRPEIDVCGRLIPTRAVGGDFFDFYFLDDRCLAFVIGDASGKGVASALFVSMARSALRSESLKTSEPDRCLSETNRTLLSGNEAMMFMTTFYGVLDIGTGELHYANAGHLPPFLLLRGGTVAALAPHPGVPLGITDNAHFMLEKVQLQPGDAIVLYTDGVTEAAALDGRQFETEGLESSLRDLSPQNCEQIVDGLVNAVNHHSAGTTQTDDIAVVALRYNGA